MAISPAVLVDPVIRSDAEDYLQSMSPETCNLGRSMYLGGSVRSIHCITPDIRYQVVVRGTQFRSVLLQHDPEEGWDTECTCSWGTDCKHASAALHALLLDPNRLPEGMRPRITLPPGASAKPAALLTTSQRGQPTSTVSPLETRIQETLGRALKSDEIRYLKEVRRLYTLARRGTSLSPFDLAPLGWVRDTWNYQPVALFPKVPDTDLEFWLYLAHALQQRNIPLPTFLTPVTDFTPIQGALRTWSRDQEVQRWSQLLSQFASPARRLPSPAATPPAPVRLRLRLTAKLPVVESCPANASAWTPLKPAQLKKYRDTHTSPPLDADPRLHLLWTSILDDRHPTYGCKAKLDYLDGTMLDRILRQPALQPLIVGPEGEPVTFDTTPLQWSLTEPGPDAEDYTLRLLGSDGLPAPVPVAVLEGDPWLLVTLHRVIPVAPYPEDLVHPDSINLIPAPALESNDGLRLLQTLQIPVPPRIQKISRIVPVTVRIRCEIKPSYPGSKNEDCTFQVRAETPDGAVDRVYAGDGHWHERPSYATRPVRQPGIVHYDETATECIPALLAPLELRWNNTLSILALRLSKTFPATFANWLPTVPKDILVELKGDLASLMQPGIAGRLSLEATETELDWFDLRVAVQIEDTTLTPEEIKLLLDARGGYVRLAGRGWQRLAFDLSTEQDEHLARLGLSPRQLSGEPQRFHALQLADPRAASLLPQQDAQQIQRRAAELKARVTPPIPDTLQAQLRPYQVDGFHFLAYLAANRFGGILADDMGLGKTVQTLAWILQLHRDRTPSADAVPPVLVVCPKSVTNNWLAESNRFAPSLRTRIWTGSGLEDLPQSIGSADLHIINYAQLRSLGESLAAIPFLAVILDEGQFIKNPGSQTAQAARALRASHRLILTGTPIENRLLDLWSLLSFAMPGILGSRAQFNTHYDPKDDPLARRRLAARVRPFLLRRTKQQVASDLPPRTEEDLYCELEGDQKLLYQAELKQARQILLGVQTQQQLNEQRFNFLTSLLRLRQTCCHPALLLPKSKQPGAKLDALLELLEPLMDEGHKVLVFSQFVEVLRRIEIALHHQDWKTFLLTGDTENRGELVDTFQNYSGAAVFLISLKAGGFGLNLTAANYVVLFDPWWNPAVENQAIDRTHRIGQSNHVIAYRLLIKDTIEEKIRLLQKRKAALADDILGEERFAQALTLDDLRFLFE